VRELGGEEIQAQARALYSYVRRGGTTVLWLNSKQFAEDDRQEIVRAYRALIAGSEA
jgi:hypothetical protein